MIIKSKPTKRKSNECYVAMGPDKKSKQSSQAFDKLEDLTAFQKEEVLRKTAELKDDLNQRILEKHDAGKKVTGVVWQLKEAFNERGPDGEMAETEYLWYVIWDTRDEATRAAAPSPDLFPWYDGLKVEEVSEAVVRRHATPRFVTKHPISWQKHELQEVGWDPSRLTLEQCHEMLRTPKVQVRSRNPFKDPAKSRPPAKRSSATRGSASGGSRGDGGGAGEVAPKGGRKSEATLAPITEVLPMPKMRGPPKERAEPGGGSSSRKSGGKASARQGPRIKTVPETKLPLPQPRNSNSASEEMLAHFNSTVIEDEGTGDQPPYATSEKQLTEALRAGQAAADNATSDREEAEFRTPDSMSEDNLDDTDAEEEEQLKDARQRRDAFLTLQSSKRDSEFELIECPLAGFVRIHKSVIRKENDISVEDAKKAQNDGELEDDKQYIADLIVAQYPEDAPTQYLVKWRGWEIDGGEWQEWEDAKDLTAFTVWEEMNPPPQGAGNPPKKLTKKRRLR